MSISPLTRTPLLRTWPGLLGPGPVHTARAPGRLDVMGGIADYSGSLVFELPLACGTRVVLQPRVDGLFLLASRCLGDEEFRAEFEADEVLEAGTPRSNEDLAEVFAADEERHWAAYALGPILHAARVLEEPVQGGLTVAAVSDVPLGAGVSSSASLEVACVAAAFSLWERRLDGTIIALLCQEAENTIARAPCGIMDQMTCAMGMERHFLSLLCQPHEIIGYHGVPHDISFVGLNTGVRHRVGGSDYGEVRTGAFMGQRIISWNVTDEDRRPDPYGGYLSNIFVSEYEALYEHLLPVEMKGNEFLIHYGDTRDRVTRVDPQKTYRVRAPTAHPIYENERVFKFLALTEAAHEAAEPEYFEQAGRLMLDSHESYRDRCRLSCEEADWIVDEVRKHGPEQGLYGAKITGGGSGGTVSVMVDARGRERMDGIAKAYASQFGRRPDILEGSSPGCLTQGVLVL